MVRIIKFDYLVFISDIYMWLIMYFDTISIGLCNSLTGFERGRWNDQHCETEGGYVCKKPEHPGPSTTVTPTSPPAGHCPSDWYEYGESL